MPHRHAFTLVELPAMSKRGFTLVELLVVIAIIIALLALLLPSLGRAVEVSNRAVCASNQHQLQLAALTYAADHMTRYPRTHRMLTQSGNETAGIDHVNWLNRELADLLIDHYTMDLLQFACPNRGPEFIWDYDAYRIRIGYYVLCGRNHPLWDALGVLGAWRSPQGARSPASWAMTSDVIEQNTIHPAPFSSASHGPGGLVIGPASTSPADLGSQGTNTSFGDASVRWRDQKDLTEYCPATGSTLLRGWW